MRYFALLLLFVCCSSFVFGQDSRKVTFPDVPGYQTISVDLHMHSVFSDGSVWPDIRVQEAIRDEIDLISLTEHLEYQPHSKDLPHPNRNRAYEVAMEVAKNSELIVVNGAEITRSMPPGHNNAVFIKDANKLLVDDAYKAFEAANDQGAFTFWNHPNWTSQRSDGIAKMEPMHEKLIAEGLLHGIEVVNELTYSDEALQIALDNDLTIMGTSDIHGLVDWQFGIQNGGHRPVTLVFAEERTAPSIKEALFDGRTAVWFRNLLIGKEEYLIPLIESSLEVKVARYPEWNSVMQIVINNPTGVKFILQNLTDYTLHANGDVVEIAPREETTIFVKTIEKLETIDLNFQVLNGIVSPKTHPEITIRVGL